MTASLRSDAGRVRPGGGRRPRHLASSRPVARVLALLAGIALAAAACGGSAALPYPEADHGPGDGGADLLGEQPAATAAPHGLAGDRSAAENGSPPSLATGPLIVRTGQLGLEVAGLDAALAAAEKIVTAAGGYVAASQRTGDDDRASASVTYRIPVERWESTLAALRGVGTKVLSEQTASEEVTSQVVDLGARLVNLRATESALQAIMAKATKIPDILEVQAQLSAVRQQVEQLTAQKQALEERAALATLAVDFSLPPVVAVVQVREGWDPEKQVDEAAATLVGIGQGVVSALIWVTIVLLPLAIGLGIIVGVAWLLVRRVRPRATRPSAPPPDVPEAPVA